MRRSLLVSLIWIFAAVSLSSAAEVLASPLPKVPGLQAPVEQDGARLAQSQQSGATQQSSSGSFYDGRIVTEEDVEAAKKPGTARPLLVLGWPCKALFAAMERGLVAAERAKLREKATDFQQRMTAAGYSFLFGGLGEKTGMGFGLAYDYPARQLSDQPSDLPAGGLDGPPAGLRLMGRGSFVGYLELMAGYGISPAEGTWIVFQSDYQWRPNEPFYGFGHGSSLDDASNFGLRQWSFSVIGDVGLGRFFRVGSEYKAALLRASDREGGGRPGVGEVFGDIQGLGDRVNLHSVGFFVEPYFFGGEYDWGGNAYFGASYQQSFSGEDDIRYWHYASRMEGRLPVARGRSAFVGQIRAELVRESSGSDPVPFYLYPRLGGLATLRGFELDRFYGRTILMLTLEYRWAIHPNVEWVFFHDGGQAFTSTEDLELFDWHRNFGMGFRLKTMNGTAFSFDVGKADEGWIVHFAFGGRPARPLSAPVRYPIYR